MSGDFAIQGLGWYVRRSGDPARLGDFYRDALGLHELRRWNHNGSQGVMLDAGHVGVLETGTGGQLAASRPQEAGMLPVFSIAREKTKEISGDISSIAISEASLRVARDRAGLWFGVDEYQQAADAAPRLRDVVLFVRDPTASAAFYERALDLQPLPRKNGIEALALGGSGRLLIAPGGIAHPPPSDRSERSDVWILRCYDYAGLRRHCDSLGLHAVNHMEFSGGWLSYYTDDDGHLFGFQERKPPDPSNPMTQLSEDIAARALWFESR